MTSDPSPLSDTSRLAGRVRGLVKIEEGESRIDLDQPADVIAAIPIPDVRWEDNERDSSARDIGPLVTSCTRARSERAGGYAGRSVAVSGDLASGWPAGRLVAGRVDERDARELARSLLAEQCPRRWTHVAAVAAEATRLTGVLSVVLCPSERALVISAAWLHDIGYAPAIARTGLHALDGARYLRRLGADARLCGLVAHHSSALGEAELRGLGGELTAEFACEQSAVSDLLWCLDLTTGPDGRRVSVDQRLSEIARRYGASSAVTLAAARGRSRMEGAVRRTERLLSAAGVPSVDPGCRVVERAAIESASYLGMDAQAGELVSLDPVDLA